MSAMNSNKPYPDYEAYCDFWEMVISPLLGAYEEKYSGITIDKYAKEIIWTEYYRLNQLCKLYYMEEADGLLDRHKVCACYIYAIVKSQVMDCELAKTLRERRYLALNEQLAITAGLSLLRAYIESSIDANHELDDDKKKVFKTRISEGIKFPHTNHGTYRDNFASELHYTRESGYYNILSLSNTLFLLETYTLQNSNPTSE